MQSQTKSFDLTANNNESQSKQFDFENLERIRELEKKVKHVKEEYEQYRIKSESKIIDIEKQIKSSETTIVSKKEKIYVLKQENT